MGASAYRQIIAKLPVIEIVPAAVAGAAVSAAIANLVGVSRGLTPDVARHAGFWVFAAVTPLALGGLVACWRLGGLKPKPDEAALSFDAPESAAP